MIKSVTIIEPNPQSDGVVELLVDSLIIKSSYVALLRPGKINIITKALQIKNLVKSWPGWTSRPWIIAGCVASSKHETIYTGPYIQDCHGDGYDEQINNLLAEFDWALFSYFTTYHNEYYNFVTSISDLINIIDLKNVQDPYRYRECYQLQSTPISCLRNATFYDYDKEGLYVYELALERNEPLPFLLCQIGPNDEMYYRWDSEKEEIEEKIWFEEAVKLLEIADEFNIGYSRNSTSYIVFRVNQMQPYLDIWKEASYNHSIANATLSGDTDLSKLRMLVSNKFYFEIDSKFDEIGTWAYSQIYGGGADEHHAIFRSRDSVITHQIWQRVGREQISRF
jgi:hypothetical protein